MGGGAGLVVVLSATAHNNRPLKPTDILHTDSISRVRNVNPLGSVFFFTHILRGRWHEGVCVCVCTCACGCVWV